MQRFYEHIRLNITFYSLVFFIMQLIAMQAQAAKQDFFNERYRGWLWFEEKAHDENQETDDRGMSLVPTSKEMEMAKLENEKFKEELDSLRHMMIRYPNNLNYIRLYKEKEKEMLDGAMMLAVNFAMVNFLNPDMADQLKNPQNIYGRNIASSEKAKNEHQIIKSLSQQIELFIFRQDNCAHCPVLEKHLNSFANKYGFKVEAVAADNSNSKYFKTHNSPELIKQLNLTVMPTVIAVTKDSAMRFELARGAVSIPDLEDNALLLAKYLRNEYTKLNKSLVGK